MDTCHLFAAGYPLGSDEDYNRTMESFHAAVGTSRVRVWHLNDSTKEFGSRVDRHAGIGRGKMGVEPFQNVLNDRRFAGLPMILETPKGMEHGRPLDSINLEVLGTLISRGAAQPSKATRRPRPKRTH